MHAEYAKTTSKLELAALFAGYCLRKWRYQISDFFGRSWHDPLVRMKSPLLYSTVNSLTTRKGCSAEYFLKSIPLKSKSLEFIFPSLSPISEPAIKSQLAVWISAPQQHIYSASILRWGLAVPLSIGCMHIMPLGIAGVLFLAPVSSYALFRFNASIRALYGARTVQFLANRAMIQYTPSRELQDMIGTHAAVVTAENGGWVWDGKGGDLHDGVVEGLEKDLRLGELVQSYRRSRLEYLVHDRS